MLVIKHCGVSLPSVGETLLRKKKKLPGLATSQDMAAGNGYQKCRTLVQHLACEP